MPDPGRYLTDLQKQRRRRRRYAAIFSAVLVLYCIGLGTLWLLFRSPLLQAQEIVVEVVPSVQGELSRAHVIDSEHITDVFGADLSARHRLGYFLGVKSFLLWPDRIPTSTVAATPLVREAMVRKEYIADRITIMVKERQPLGIWCIHPAQAKDASDEAVSAPSCFWFDDDGVLFEGAFAAEGSLLRVVNDYSGRPLALGEPVLPSDELTNLLSVLETVAASTLAVQNVMLPAFTLRELEVATYDGPVLYFSLRFPAAQNGEVIRTLQETQNFRTLRYIDFRVENRVYYR